MRENLLAPGDEGFDHARQAWNLAVDQRPAAIVTAASPEDVIGAVRLAQERGLRIAAQGTGHGAATLGALEDTILVKTDRLRGIRIDPERRVARIEAGVTWLEAAEETAHHGLALLAGSAPDVGVVGYTLGGGLSWLARKHGLTCSSVRAFEVVTSDGRLVRADHSHEPDLFWALRGGGGGFGIVTAIEFELLEIRDVYAGILWWPIERGEEVMHAWRGLTEQGLRDELTTVGRFLRLPELPEIPQPVRGRPFAVVEAFHLGSPSAADELLAPLRALGPEIDTIETVPVEALAHLHMDPDRPVPAVGDGLLLDALPPEAIDNLTRIAGAGVDTPLISVEVRQLGGELARSRPGHGALSNIDAAYALYAVGLAPTEQAAGAIRSSLDDLAATMAPWTAGQMCMNFAETPRDPASLWSESSHRRLQEIKAKYDPDDLIRSNHPIHPA